MIDRPEAEQTGDQPGASGAKPKDVTVVFSCNNRTYVVRLDPAEVRLIFFDRERRDEVWDDREDVTVLRTDRDWEEASHVLLEGPTLTDEPPHSGDCFCFEDMNSRRYCVCGM